MQHGIAACLLLRVIGTGNDETVDHRLCPLHRQGLGAGEKQHYHAASAAVLAPSLLQGQLGRLWRGLTDRNWLPPCLRVGVHGLGWPDPAGGKADTIAELKEDQTAENAFCSTSHQGLVSNLRIQQFSRIRKLMQIPEQTSSWRKLLTSFS